MSIEKPWNSLADSHSPDIEAEPNTVRQQQPKKESEASIPFFVYRASNLPDSMVRQKICAEPLLQLARA